MATRLACATLVMTGGTWRARNGAVGVVRRSAHGAGTAQRSSRGGKCTVSENGLGAIVTAFARQEPFSSTCSVLKLPNAAVGAQRRRRAGVWVEGARGAVFTLFLAGQRLKLASRAIGATSLSLVGVKGSGFTRQAGCIREGDYWLVCALLAFVTVVRRGCPAKAVLTIAVVNALFTEVDAV